MKLFRFTGGRTRPAVDEQLDITTFQGENAEERMRELMPYTFRDCLCSDIFINTETLEISCITAKVLRLLQDFGMTSSAVKFLVFLIDEPEPAEPWAERGSYYGKVVCVAKDTYEAEYHRHYKALHTLHASHICAA